MRHLRYEALRKSLQDTVEAWPYVYEHKIIGKNKDQFISSVKILEERFPRMNKKNSHISRNGTYLAVTYEIMARDVDEIISLWVASEELEDFVTVL